MILVLNTQWVTRKYKEELEIWQINKSPKISYKTQMLDPINFPQTNMLSYIKSYG